MSVPPEITESVKRGECILFLGAMASALAPEISPFVNKYKLAPPSATDLSKALAEASAYPDEDRTNLQRVSLHYQHRPGGSRYSLIHALSQQISAPDIGPSPALLMLAALPFRIIITTNYDHFFDQALRQTQIQTGIFKDPLVRVYDPTRSHSPEDVPLDPKVEKPVLLKLHGDIDKPESIVITEEDYIEFIQRMSTPHLHPIHPNIRARMNSWPILFIGYSLKDYNLRLLFRTLRWHLHEAHFPLSFSVDPYPDNLIVTVWEHGQQKFTSFIRQDLWEFVPELYEQCKGVQYQP